MQMQRMPYVTNISRVVLCCCFFHFQISASLKWILDCRRSLLCAEHFKTIYISSSVETLILCLPNLSFCIKSCVFYFFSHRTCRWCLRPCVYGLIAQIHFLLQWGLLKFSLLDLLAQFVVIDAASNYKLDDLTTQLNRSIQKIQCRRILSRVLNFKNIPITDAFLKKSSAVICFFCLARWFSACWRMKKRFYMCAALCLNPRDAPWVTSRWISNH